MSNHPVGRLGSFAQGLIRTASLERQTIRLGGWAPSPKGSSELPRLNVKPSGWAVGLLRPRAHLPSRLNTKPFSLAVGLLRASAHPNCFAQRPGRSSERARHHRAPSPKGSYRGRCRKWLFAHMLPNGRKVGSLRVDEATREILGEVIQKIKASGLGVSTIEHVRMPLRGFYRDLVERKVLTVNPARISDSSRGACDGASASRSSRPRKPPNSSLLRSANEATGKKRRRPGLRAPPSEQRPTDLAATTASDADEARNTQAPDRRGSTCPRSIRDRSRRTALGPRPRRLAARLPPHSLPLRRRWT